MKKFVFAFSLVVLSVCGALAADIPVEPIGPTSLSQNAYTTTISTPGDGYRNCLTEFTIGVSSNSIVRFLSGSTTNFAIDLSTSIRTTVNQSPTAAQPFRMTWPLNDPFCADYDQTFGFTVFSGTYSVTHNMNYRGYIYKRQ